MSDFGPSMCTQALEDLAQADERPIGVFLNHARDLRRLGDDVALALGPLLWIGGTAFKVPPAASVS